LSTNIEIYRGEYKQFTFQALRNSVATDITDASLYFVVRTSYPASTVTDDTAAILTKTVGSGIELSDPTSGYFIVTFTKNDTYSLIPKNYYYSVEIILSGETDPRVLGVGYIKIAADIVREV